MIMGATSDCAIWTKGLAGNCEGRAAVEFAFLIPVLLILIFAVYEFGRAYWIQNTLQYAAEQTARCVLAKSSASPGTIVDTTSAGACPYTDNTAGMTVTRDPASNTLTNCPTTFATFTPKCQTVKLTYSFTFNGFLTGLMARFGGLKNTAFNLVGEAQVPIS